MKIRHYILSYISIYCLSYVSYAKEIQRKTASIHTYLCSFSRKADFVEPFSAQSIEEDFVWAYPADRKQIQYRLNLRWFTLEIALNKDGKIDIKSNENDYATTQSKSVTLKNFSLSEKERFSIFWEQAIQAKNHDATDIKGKIHYNLSCY